MVRGIDNYVWTWVQHIQRQWMCLPTARPRNALHLCQSHPWGRQQDFRSGFWPDERGHQEAVHCRCGSLYCTVDSSNSSTLGEWCLQRCQMCLSDVLLFDYLKLYLLYPLKTARRVYSCRSWHDERYLQIEYNATLCCTSTRCTQALPVITPPGSKVHWVMLSVLIVDIFRDSRCVSLLYLQWMHSSFARLHFHHPLQNSHTCRIDQNVGNLRLRGISIYM